MSSLIVCLVCPSLWAWFELGMLQSVSGECVSSLLTVGIGCPTACGLGVGSEGSGSSFLVIVCIGGEGGIAYSSIWLLIVEAGVVGFVVFCRGLPCVWMRLVCEIGRCCMIV